VLVVMLLLAVTLGLAYAVLRAQTTALWIQHNADLRVSAREAALAGLTVALKKMHTSEWCYGEGVYTTLTGSLGDYESYQVSYCAGDPSLAVDDPDYPYRVTLVSVGTATDPSDPARTSTHRAQAVVRLAPRSVAEQPSDWTTMQQYTVYQSKKDPFEVDIPCRLEGPVRVQGKLKIATHYPDGYDPWQRYLDDLNDMRLDGYPDYRPFNGPVALPFSEQDFGYLFALTGCLAVTATNTPVNEAGSDWTIPTSLTSYQIYPGGPVYAIPQLGDTLDNTTLEGDAAANPLGLYHRGGDITLRDNVTVRGSLFCNGEIRVEGVNVHFEPVQLIALYGSEAPGRLPVATCNKFIVKPGGQGSLTGLLAVFDEFKIEKSPDTTEFPITGRLIIRKLFIKERQPWETVNWGARRDAFVAQLAGKPPVVRYFPVWMGHQGYDPAPLLTVRPDANPVAYHWKDPYDPIYVPHPDDDGLRWDLIEWTDSL